MVFHELLDALVREVLHAEDADRERDLVRDIAETDRVELTLSDSLHLAGSTNDTDLVKAIAPCCLLDEGDVGADIIPGSP